jgi:uncharacterized protein
VGLKLGEHQYEFLIDDKFFSEIEYSLIDQADIKVDLVLLKQDSMMILNFDIVGTIRVTCDRCLEEFDLPVEGSNRLIIKLGDVPYEESEDVLVISKDDYELDVAQYIYEFISLLKPIQVIHPNDSCDKAVLDLLKKHATKESTNADPRWEALKGFFNKN